MMHFKINVRQCNLMLLENEKNLHQRYYSKYFILSLLPKLRVDLFLFKTKPSGPKRSLSF